MAASLVGIAPVLIVFIFLQKYIVEGLTAGAVKN
jgi:multiple sugar transport system permease protein